MNSQLPERKPEWLKVKSTTGAVNREVNEMLRSLSLNTVCEEAGCPNYGECFSRGTATFMILGTSCTRNCSFCQVNKGIPSPVDSKEPENIAVAVEKLNLRHVVITSVTRDDLPDGGSSHFASVIKSIRERCKRSSIEVLIPDFQGDLESLKTVINAKPDIINHNIETINRLYPQVRPQAVYNRSLELLSRVKGIDSSMITKSGIMLGLGEKYEEVVSVMQDLLNNGCDILTIGQYLAPSKKHIPVVEYVHPDVFAEYKKVGERMGFKYVVSGPLVRSSYMADIVYSMAGAK